MNKIEYVDQVRVDPITGEAILSDNSRGSVILPEMTVRPQHLTRSAYHPEDVEQAFNLTGLGMIFNPFRLARTSNQLLTQPSFNNTVEVAHDVLPWSKAGRAILGTYNLFNENGVGKTFNHLANGELGDAALSGLGDLFNAAMAVEGGGGVYNQMRTALNKPSRAYRYLTDPNNFRIANPYTDYFLNNKSNVKLLPQKDPSIDTVNKILAEYGYDTIDPRLPKEEIDRLFLDRMKQHRTFLRGVYLPDKNGFRQDIKNYENLRKQALKYFGDDSEESMLKVAATTTALEDTGYGRQGLYNALRARGLPTDGSFDALYTSNRSQVAEGYSLSNWSKSVPGAAFKIQVPINDVNGGSYVQRWMANEFPITSDNLYPNQTFWREAELPFLARTGKHSYEMAPPHIQEQKRLFTTLRYGKTKLSPQEINRQVVHDMNAYYNVRYTTDKVNRLLQNFGLSEIYPTYNQSTGVFQNAFFMSKLADRLEILQDFFPRYEAAVKDFLSLGDDAPREMRNNSRNTLKSVLQVLKDDDIITQKQYYNYVDKIDKNPEALRALDKQILAKKLVKQVYNIVSKRRKALLRNAFSKNSEIKPQQSNPALQNSEKFYKGFTIPELLDYIPGRDLNWNNGSKDGLQVFTTEGIRMPDATDTRGTHFVFIAPRDTKIADVIEKVQLNTQRKNHGHGGSIYPGISRNLGAMFPFGIVGAAGVNQFWDYNNDNTQRIK